MRWPSIINLCFLVSLAALFTARHPVSLLQSTANGLIWVDHGAQSKHEGALSGAPLSNAMQSGLRNFIDEIDNLWDRAMIMRLWILEYQTTTWAKTHPMTGAEADLFEARFHVANAEVFGAALKQENRAKLELEQAENYLIETRPLIQMEVRADLEMIEKEISAVQGSVEWSSSENPEPYERVKSDLDRLIENLRVTHA